MSLCFPLNDGTIQLLLIHVSGHKDSKSNQTVALCPRGGALPCSGWHPLSFPNGCGRAEALLSCPLQGLVSTDRRSRAPEVWPWPATRAPCSGFCQQAAALLGGNRGASLSHTREREGLCVCVRTRPQAAEGARGQPAGGPDREASEEMSSLSHQGHVCSLQAPCPSPASRALHHSTTDIWGRVLPCRGPSCAL